MSRYALTSTGDHLRRFVVRAVGTLTLGAAGLALGVCLAAPSNAADRPTLGSVLGDTVEATVQTVARTTGALGSVTRIDQATTDSIGSATTPTAPGSATPAPAPEPSAPAPAPAAQAAAEQPEPASGAGTGKTVDAAAVKPASARPAPSSAGKVTEPVTKAVDEVAAATGGLLDPVTEPVRTAVTEPVGAAVTEITKKPVAQVAEVVEQVADPVLKPVTEQVGAAVKPVTEPLGDVLAPVTGVVGQVVTPLAPVLSAVTEPLAPVTDGLLSPVVDIVSPVTDVVGGVTAPVLGALEPVTAPVTDALSPVLTPVGEAVAPVGEVLAPVVEPLSPVVEPLAPVTDVVPAAPSAPGEPVTVIPTQRVEDLSEPTYPGELQASGDAAGVVVWTSAGVRHAMLDLVQAPVVEAAVDTAQTLGAMGVVEASAPGLLGGGLPLTAGGFVPAVAASGAGGVLGGAPQLKVPGGDLLAMLSALLIFRARTWRVSADESRAKLASSYTDIPVSPA